jgi:outer membrane protein OmpA-like peptidoglycan-associated protein
MLPSGAWEAQAQTLDRKKAEELVEQGEYVRALEIYKALYARGVSLESSLDLAKTYKDLRNYDEAEKYYSIATRYPEAPADSYCDYGDMLMFNGKYDEARQVYFTYATRGGNPNIARMRIFSCDSAYSIAKRPPLYSVMNERRINTKYSDFCAVSAGRDYFVFTSDRPIDYKSTDREEMSATLGALQGAGSDVATLLLLRNAQDPTDMANFNRKVVTSDSMLMVHSVYEGEEFDASTEKERSKRRSREKRERKELEKLLEKKKKTYGGTGRPYLNMYVTSRQPKAENPGKGVLGNIVWTAPVLLPSPLNTGEHTGPSSFTPDGNTMYFSFAEQMTEGAGAGATVSHVGVMVSHKNDEGGWEVPVLFPYNKRNEYSVGHTCITKDGRILYFSSDMPGTLGGRDIFKCELQPDGTWGTPINLGPIINTIGQEQFPTLGPNDELYFSSDGHPGLGGLDIFKAMGKPGEWTGVMNMRKPINSSSDDFSFVFLVDSKTQGVFSSNRPGGYGDDDIYSFRTVVASEPKVDPKGKPQMVVSVFNRADSSLLEGVQLTLMNVKTKKGEVMTSDAEGRAYFTITPRSFYNLSSQMPGYLLSEINGINTGKIKQGEIMKVALPLDPLVIGGAFKVDNVNYAYGKATLQRSAFKELNKVVKFMKDNPTVKIELGSHSDSRGSLAGNMKLSKQRAQACVTYLVKKGIAKNRIVPKGYGPTKPLIKKARTEKQHAKNRRTEIKILEVTDPAPAGQQPPQP